MTDAQKIIQMCLYEGGPVTKAQFGITPEIVRDMRNLLAPLNLELIETNNHVEIGLSTEIADEISKQKIEELKTELSESSLQTLSIVLYRPGCTKPEIDFIRGVDSVRSIKSLITRGLVEKSIQKNKNQYHPTTETLKFLGINTVEKLPDFIEINAKLDQLISG